MVKSFNIELTPTDKLSAKLKVIAKHAAELAKELDEIENNWCDKCKQVRFKKHTHEISIPKHNIAMRCVCDG